MSNTKDYTITTVLSSSKQYGSGAVSGKIVTSQAPFGLRPYMARFRGSCTPYSSGPTTATQLDLRVKCSPFAPTPTPTTDYIEPFMYLQFEASASTYVTGISGSQSSYTGSMTSSTLGCWPCNGVSGPPQYASTIGYGGIGGPAFSGSYSMRWGDWRALGDGPSEGGYVDFGSVNERPEWGTLLSGSYTISMWVNQQRYSGLNHLGYNGLFSVVSNVALGTATDYSFIFSSKTGPTPDACVDGAGALTCYEGQSVGAWTTWVTPTPCTGKDPSLTDVWHHVVFVVSGSISDPASRSITSYVNNYNFGAGGAGFTGSFDPDHRIKLGNWASQLYYAFEGAMDEVSIWSEALTAGQINVLYNGGSGSYAMTALTSSS